ncbi:MAG: aspartate-semialdehyde dehydrogenase, partial [Thermotogota bacterium]
LIEEFDLPVEALRVFASKRSAGSHIKYKHTNLKVEELTDEVMSEQYDYLLFSAGGGVSKRFAPTAASAGNVVIDNSSVFRAEDGIPLVVPEINGHLLENYRGIIANPNCSTIQMVLALNGLRDFGLREIVVSTYQSISGAGRKALDEYYTQMEWFGKGQNVRENFDKSQKKVFEKPIFANVIPLIGEIDPETGMSSEDLKMINETRKIFGDDSITVYPFAARVASEYAHGESVLIKLEEDTDLSSFVEAVQSTPNVKYSVDIVTSSEAAGTDITYVSRVRKMAPRVFMIWVVADNIRVGAATNALRILAEHRRINQRR